MDSRTNLCPQARRGNMADLAAKDGSQETLVNLVALCCNLLLLLGACLMKGCCLVTRSV